MKTENYNTIVFTDIFDLEEIQKMQDLFSDATGVASLITNPDGIPITRPSNFCRLCNEIRKTEKGRTNCFKSDAIIGKMHKSEPLLERCLSAGLLDSGANITVGGHHIANWLIGQVRNEKVDEQQILNYADEIGANRDDFLRAYHEVPEMSVDQFSKVSKMLFAFANQLSEKAYQNLRLKESEAKFQSLFMNMSEGASLHELIYNNEGLPEDYKIIETNPAFTRQLGISRDRAIGKKSREVYNVDEPPYLEIYSKVALTGEPTIFEAYFPPFKKHFSISVYCPYKGSFATIFENITERRKIENALQANEEKHRVLFENSPEAYLTILNGKFTDCNKAAEKLLCRTREQIIGQPPEKLSPEFQPDGELSEIAAKNRIAEAIEHGFISFEWVHHRLDGSNFLAEISIAVMQIDGQTALFSVMRDITKRKKTEEALRESEEKHRFLIENNQDIIYTLNREGVFTFVSPSWTAQLGHHIDQVTGKSFSHFVHPDDLPRCYVFLKKIIQPEQVNEGVEYRVKHLNGSWFWHFSTAVPLRNEAGIVTGFQGTGRDITQRKLAETALKESEEKYRTLVETMTDGVYRSTHDGKFIEVNPAMVKILGYDSKEELLSIDIKTQLYYSEEERESADLDEKLEEMAIFRLRKKDGSEIWVEDHGRHVLDEKGNILFHEGALRDVTERKLAEFALQRSEERYRSLIENMGEGVAFTNPDNVFIFANQSAERIFGVDKDKLKGLNLFDFLTHENTASLKSGLKQRISGKSSVIELEICLFDGSKKHILLTATPSYANKKFLGTFGIFRDITERKKAEYEINLKNETLQKLNATKDKFFSIIAHDLKSPFNSIMGFSELLVEQIKAKDYDGIEKYAGIILGSSQRAMDLLINLMEWSRSQTGRIEFNPEFIEMVDILNETELLFDEIARQKSIVIKKILPRHVPVFADKAMINTVLRNLVSNAIKFTKSGGKIIISITEKPNEITVSVKDSGIGISADRIDKLFRLDESYSTPGTNNEKGTGLGLILCKEFIEKHGGRIWVESEAGKGSVFSFSLPLNEKL